MSDNKNNNNTPDVNLVNLEAARSLMADAQGAANDRQNGDVQDYFFQFTDAAGGSNAVKTGVLSFAGPHYVIIDSLESKVPLFSTLAVNVLFVEAMDELTGPDLVG